MNLMRAVLVLVLAFPVLAGAQLRPVATIEADRIVAVVNNEVITLRELQAGIAVAERQISQQGTALPPRDVLERHLLERMIAERIQVQLARESGISVDDAQLDRAVSNIAQANRMSPGDFRAALERDGIPWLRFREDIRKEMLIARIKEREVDSRIAVSDGEIDNFLASAQSNAGSEEFELAHILLRMPERASPEEVARIRARADEIIGKLGRGADFAQLAVTYSDAPDSLSGGAMGWRPVARLPTLYAEAAASLKPGEVSAGLRSPAGFHVLKLLGRRGGTLAVAPVQQTRARHILIRTSEVTSEADAKRRLVEIKERVDNGVDFAELARLHSNDLSAANGGALGWLNPGDTVPEFERALDALKINQVSEPVQSPFGWHLIQVLERRIDVSEQRLRLHARQTLRDRKAEEAYQEWLRLMRDRAYVEYRLDVK